MRKAIYSMSVSLDGFAETADRSLDWVIVDEELHTAFNEEARALGASLYGRRMYELMAEYWPTTEAQNSTIPYIAEFSRIWLDTPKIVFSSTLGRVEWNSRLVKSDAAEEVRRLKTQPGRDLSVSGPTLAASLMQHGLIDEYRLYVNPVILGSGTPFFPVLQHHLPLRLVETRRFQSGVVYLRYEQ